MAIREEKALELPEQAGAAVDYDTNLVENAVSRTPKSFASAGALPSRGVRGVDHLTADDRRQHANLLQAVRRDLERIFG